MWILGSEISGPVIFFTIVLFLEILCCVIPCILINLVARVMFKISLSSVATCIVVNEANNDKCCRRWS